VECAPAPRTGPKIRNSREKAQKARKADSRGTGLPYRYSVFVAFVILLWINQGFVFMFAPLRETFASTFFAFFALFCGYSDLFPMESALQRFPYLTLAFCGRFMFRRTRGNLREQRRPILRSGCVKPLPAQLKSERVLLITSDRRLKGEPTTVTSWSKGELRKIAEADDLGIRL
jgi:hypothetical protein